MRICLACGSRFRGDEWACTRCGDAPGTVDGFPAFAPELARGGAGYQPEHFADLAKLESVNWWFRARNRLITWAITKYFGSARNLLEIGCGTGFVLTGIHAAIPHIELSGSEVYAEGLAFARKRLPAVRLYQMDARRVPFEEEFDVVAAFDVLEHIDDDRAVLRQMNQSLRCGGGLLLTVPQHPALWSHQDEFASHRRRYTAHELKEKVIDAGFELVRVTSFVTLLLPLMYAVRSRKRKPMKNSDDFAELRIGGAANRILEHVMNLERLLIRAGASLPAGGSLLLVGRKS